MDSAYLFAGVGILYAAYEFTMRKRAEFIEKETMPMSNSDENIIDAFHTEDGYDVEIELADTGGIQPNIHVNFFGGTLTALISLTKEEAQELIAGLTKAVVALAKEENNG